MSDDNKTNYWLVAGNVVLALLGLAGIGYHEDQITKAEGTIGKLHFAIEVYSGARQPGEASPK